MTSLPSYSIATLAYTQDIGGAPQHISKVYDAVYIKLQITGECIVCTGVCE